MKGKRITAAEWNAEHAIGTQVRYWPGSRTGEQPRCGTTRSTAWEVPTGGDPIAVVLVSGYPGGIALTHVEPVEPAGGSLETHSVAARSGQPRGAPRTPARAAQTTR